MGGESVVSSQWSVWQAFKLWLKSSPFTLLSALLEVKLNLVLDSL